MDEIGLINQKRTAAHQKLLAMDCRICRAFPDMEAATYASGALARNHKELVVMDWESCKEWHIEQGAKAGATQREVLEAVEVGIEIGAGRATVSARFAPEVMETVFGS